jgi:choline dehydrogenase-like flavoprotein
MPEEIKTDYCVVGGGIAGILLAYKLAASGRKIVLLDQGPHFTEEDRAKMLLQSQAELNDFADYNDNVDPLVITPHSTAETGEEIVKYTNYRLFGIGGTALHFQGIMMRPLEEDMQVKSLFGYGRDWPIPYSELEPWLLRAEKEIGVSGNNDNPYASPRSGPFPMPAHPFSYFDKEIFGPALKKLGISGHSCPFSVNSRVYNNRPACQACRACKFCPSGARYSPDRVHFPLLKEKSNVSVLENISLRKLETGINDNQIVAAHAMRIQGRIPLIVQANKFILAMGGIETPRILLLSASKGLHKDGLGNLGGQLGQGFSDHDGPLAVCDTGKNVGNRLGFETMMTDHFRINDDRRRIPTFSIFGSPATDWINIGNAAMQWATKDNIISLNELRSGMKKYISLWTQTELQGNGTLELDSDNLDEFGSPVAKITMKLNDWDQQGYSKAVEVISQIGEAMGAQNISDIPPPGDGLGYHPSGATAMAKNPDEGVCDANLKVFGLENLYLVSSSVFPHLGSNPPTLTIAALALRLAAHLEG